MTKAVNGVVEKSEAVSAPENPFQKWIEKRFEGKSFTPEEMETYLNRLVDPESKEALGDAEWEAIRPRISWKQQSDMLGLALQPYIPEPPLQKKRLWEQACSGDGVTVDSWRKQWMDQTKENVRRFSPLKTPMEEWGKAALKPVIIAGSGPSLKKNVDVLAKDKGDITLVSCSHNFGFFEDSGVHAEYYINLDAGDITIPELSEGGKRNAEEYWSLTKDKTLLTSITGNPKFIEKWKGKVLFFNVPIPDLELSKFINNESKLNVHFSVGGNALGACFYFAKAVLGGNPIAFVGADFSFGYDRKFHPFSSQYDSQFSGLIPATDIYGNRVYTWPSYYNFKAWFEYMAMGGEGGNPGSYVNCTEGGILGAYPQGNIMQIKQQPLQQFLFEYNLHKQMPEAEKSPVPMLLF